jgi:5-methylcytosine-specific restriction endonuclease McrA
MTFKSFKRYYRQKYHPLECLACGTPFLLEFHHIVPISVNHELECVESNIVILCRLHHKIFGHLGNWNNYNPNVYKDSVNHKNKFPKIGK